jgi:3-hydroxyisobutyrate dehydrogenase-like beta-hydroxyacid dehydrogenase
MLEVTVIGLGLMGTALARGLLRSGARVTVWNRSIAKAAPLVAEGAALAPSAAAAARPRRRRRAGS